MNKLCSCIVPCFNEEKVIPIYYDEMQKVMKQEENIEFEIIFVDDGSKDGTLEIMRKLSEQDPKVHYISFSRNFGKEAALYAGLERAKGDYVITMDVDLQDPPYLIPKMIRCIEEENYDSVATRRVTREGEPVIRSFFARQFYKLINKISDSNIVDGARDFRMMKRKMVDAILTMPEYNRFTKGIFGWVGFETKWLEYKNVERAAGVVSLKRLLNQSILKSWSSKMIKKSLEAYFFTLKTKIVFCKKQFQNMSVFCFASTEIV